ncbi:hypothetical protein D3C87_1605570 [compost metagenome]
MIGRDVQRTDRRGIAEAAIGDDAGDPADHQPRDENVTGGCGARVLAAVHHQNVPGRAVLHRDALRVVRIAELAQLIAVLASRNIAQRVGRADHVDALGPDRMHPLDDLIAQAALEQGSSKGCDRNGHELVAKDLVHVEDLLGQLVLGNEGVELGPLDCR